MAGTNFNDTTNKAASADNTLEVPSTVVDGASAIGFDLDTVNELSTDGSKILSVKNNSLNAFDIRRGLDVFATDSTMAEIFNNAGNLGLQISADGQTIYGAEGNLGVYIYGSDDYSQGAGYSEGYLGVQPASITANAIFEEFTLSSFGATGSSAGAIASMSAGSTGIISDDPSSGLERVELNTSDTNLRLRQVDGSNADSPVVDLKVSTVTKFAVTKNGGILVNRTATAVSADSAQETIIGVTDTSVARTITLKQNDSRAGRIIIVKDESGAAATNNITIATEGAETIDGAATQVITANYGVGRFYSDGTNWFSF
jgi:hypothetical protein